MNTAMPVTPQKCVWVVDDDETVLMLAEDVLVGEGFRVKTFADAIHAIEALTLDQPDIMVMDVMMPGMDGFEFCRRLRANPATQDIPVLIATSLDDLGSINRAYEAGATNFATKPMNWAIETHRLRYLLRAAETSRELKAKERETRLAKEDWERTFNSFSDIVTLLSPELKVIRANSATCMALQKPLEKVVDAHCYRLFQDRDQPCPNCPIARAVQKNAPVSEEVRYGNPGTDCLVTGTPVRDDEGRLLHVVHLARDLTEQKQLEREYRHAQKMEAVGTLAGGIAHDFNNLLMVVSGCADLIKTDVQATGEQLEVADMITDTVQRGAALARHLLTFSRKGVAKTDKASLSINDITLDARKMLGRILPKQIMIRTLLADDLSRVNASADQLHQILMNLAVNASHAMPGGGTLTVETRNVHLDSSYCSLHPEFRPGDYVLVAVSDTGQGMDKWTMQRIFEPFFTTKKVGEGTGLGLSVVYGLVRDHSGHILCYSEVGQGTTFKLYFPAIAASESGAQSPPRNRVALPGGNETILIVDDEAHLRNLVRIALMRAGYTILSAGDGESALARYREDGGRIRLVLMDLGMPGMGGWECLRRLRTINPLLPVLITTGYGGEELPERALKEGAVGLIGKPYQMDVLFNTVRQVLDRLPSPGLS